MISQEDDYDPGMQVKSENYCNNVMRQILKLCTFGFQGQDKQNAPQSCTSVHIKLVSQGGFLCIPPVFKELAY